MTGKGLLQKLLLACLLVLALANDHTELRRNLGHSRCAGDIHGWKLWAGKCYKHFDTDVTYNTAKSECERYGAHLAVPNDESENEMLIDMVGSEPQSWLGFDFDDNQKWADGSSAYQSDAWEKLYTVHDADDRKDEPALFLRATPLLADWRWTHWSFDEKTNEHTYLCEHPGWTCTCNNGRAASDDCTTNGEQCASCNSGYELKNGVCNKKAAAPTPVNNKPVTPVIFKSTPASTESKAETDEKLIMGYPLWQVAAAGGALVLIIALSFYCCCKSDKVPMVLPQQYAVQQPQMVIRQ